MRSIEWCYFQIPWHFASVDAAKIVQYFRGSEYCTVCLYYVTDKKLSVNKRSHSIRGWDLSRVTPTFCERLHVMSENGSCVEICMFQMATDVSVYWPRCVVGSSRS